MPGQIVHFEIPADDTAKSREFWGGLVRVAVRVLIPAPSSTT